MKKLQILIIVFLISLSICAFANMQAKAQYTTLVPLGRAASFSVLAGSAITNTGSTTITGDVGISPGLASSVTGSPVTIKDGTLHYGGDATAQNAQTDLLTAYKYVAGQADTENVTADLGGQTLTPGVYDSAILDSSLGLTGTLTLNGEENPDSVFIFQAGSTLTTASGSDVSLINGAQACNVFWQVGSSATIGSDSTLVGNILALTSITLTTGATVNGRVLAINGAVTLDNNTIGLPTITLTLATGHVGDTVTLSGSGFAADSTFSATFADSTVTLSGTTTTDGSGNIPSGVTFTVPTSTDGNQTVIVTDASSNSASATFTVTPDQYLVTFSSSGLGDDATGNLVTFSVTGGSYSGATSPIDVSGGSIWVDSGASVTYSFVNPVTSSVTGKQYRLDGVTGSTSPITVSSNTTVTGNYVTQWQVTFAQTGLDSDATGTVVTVNSVPYIESELPIDIWVTSGSSVSYSFSSTVASSASPSTTRYSWSSTSGLDTVQTDTLSVSGAGSVTGNYVTEYYLTVVTSPSLVDSTTGSGWYQSGATASISAPATQAIASGSQYSFNGWTGATVDDASAYSTSLTMPASATTVTANYVTQYDLVFAVSGLDSSAQGTIVSVTIGANSPVDVAYGSLPMDFGYVDAGTTVTYVFTSTVGSSNSGEQFALTTPDASPASGFSLSAATTVTGTYKTQYDLVFAQSGVGSDFSGTVVTVNGTVYDRNGAAFWADSGDVYNFTYASPLGVNSDEQYVLTGVSGNSTASSLTVSAATTVTGTYVTQWYISVTSAHGSPSEASQWVTAGSSFIVSVTAPAVVDGTHQWNLTGLLVDGSSQAVSDSVTFDNVQLAHSVEFDWTENYYITVVSAYGSPTEGSQWVGAGTSFSVSVTSPDVVTSGADQWVVSGPSTQTISDVESAQTLTFSWTEQFYITVVSAYGSPTEGSQWVNADTDFTVSVTAPDVVGTGHRWNLTGLVVDSSVQTVSDSVTFSSVDAAHSVEFDWTQQWYITVVSAHGSPSEASQWVNAGSSFSTSVTSPADVVSDVSQWVTSQSTLSIADVESAQTLTFSWTEQFYITVNADGHGSPTEVSQWVNQSSSFSVSVTAPDVVDATHQWNLTGLVVDSVPATLSDSVTFNDVQAAHSVEFDWTENFYITVDNGGHGTPSQGSGWAEKGSSFSTSVTSPADTVSGTQYVADSTTLSIADVESAQTLTFSWTEQFYITVSSNFGGVSPASGWYNAGAVVPVSATAPSVVSGEQYVWNGWTSSGTGGYTGLDNPTTGSEVTMNGPITETASWTHQYQLTVTTNFGATTGAGWYDAGSTATVSATAPSVVDGERYVWNTWTGTGSDGNTTVSNPAQVTMNSPVTETASWTHQFDITVDANGHGSPSEASQWVTAGSDFTVSVTSPDVVTPGEDKWVVSGPSTQTISDVESAQTLTFSWTEQFYLTMSANFGSTGPVSGWYDAGTVVNIAAYSPTVVSGERFLWVGWTGSGTISYTGAVNESSVTMNSAVTETASWTHQFDLTVDTGGHGVPSEASQWVNAGSSFSTSVTSPADVVSDVSQWVTSQSTLSIADVESAQTLTFSWTEQYYLTVSSANGSPSGQGWYNVGATANAGLASGTVSGNAGTQYIFIGWSGDASGTDYSSSAAITMSGPKTATADWKTQYELSFHVTGLDSDASSNTVLSVGSTNYVYSDFPVDNIWVDSGTTFSWSSPVSGGSGERFVLTSDNSGLTSPIEASGTDTATYKTQCKVTFTASANVLGDSSTTIVTVGGSGETLPFTTGWLDSGSSLTYSFASPVTSSSSPSNTQYRWGSTSGLSQTLQSNTFTASVAGTVTGTYVTQYKVTFAQSGLTSDASGTVVTVAGATKVYTDLPFTTGWIDSGSSLSWSFSSPVTSTASPASIQYRWGSTSGLSQSGQSGSLTVTAPGTVTGTYVTQYKVSFDASSNVKGDSSGTIVTVGGSAKASGVLPFTTDWIDSGATVTWAFASPVASTLDASGTRYSWTSTVGLSQSGQSGTLTVSAAGTVTGTYTTQYKATASYSTSDSSIPSASVTLSGTAVGSPSSTTLTTTPQTVWLDSGTGWSVNNPITSGNQRWDAASGTSGTMSGAITIAPSYYHQYQVTASYSTSDGSTPSSSATLSGTQFGSSSYTLTLSTSAQTPWLDAGTGWSVNNPITSGLQRWNAASGTSGTVTGVVTIAPSYYHQYQVTFAVSPSGTGSTSPAGTNVWEDAGSLGISATANSGYLFSTWSSNTGSITFNSANSASTTATISGSGIITSNFLPATSNLPAVDHFVFSAVVSQTAGTSFSVTITAVDSSGNTVTSYSGTNTLGVSTGAISPTSTGAFSNGVWSGSVTLTGAGSGVTLSTSGSGKSGTSNSVTVTHASAVSIAVSPATATVTAGGAETYTATASDSFGNTWTVSAVWSIGSGAGGSWSSNVYTSEMAGTWTVTGTHLSLSYTASLMVDPGAATQLAVSSGTSQVAGMAFSVTVTAEDAYGNTATGYTGLVHFSSSDSGSVSLPSDYTFLSGDLGTHTFTNGVTLVTAGTGVSVTATDTVTSSITGSQIGITVTHAAAASSVAITPANSAVTAGGAETYTATATDAYGNTWDVTSSTNWRISSGAGGSWLNNVYTSAKAGSWTVTGTYNSAPYTTGLTVNPAVLDHFVFNTVATQTAGSAFNITVTAKDAYGNAVTSYTGTPSLSYSAGSISPNAMGAFVNGVGTTTVTVTDAGSGVTITATVGSHTGTSNSFTVNPTISASAGANGAISPTGSVSVNYSDNQSFTITANSGYHIADVVVDGVSQGAVSSYTFTNVQAAHTISATFAINTYAITPVSGGHGTISPDSVQIVNYGATSSFIFTPDTGYHIVNVQVDGVSVLGDVSDNVYTFSAVSADHTIFVAFAIDTSTITASAGADGGISPSGSVSVNYGSDQSFTITASTGYHIVDVVVDGVSQGAVSSYTFTNVQAAHMINASFAIGTYTTTTIIGIESNTTILPITLEGNITAQQMLTNVTITPNPLNTTTTLSFTITGPSGTVGFCNMTLPKTAIPYGTTPVVYIDGQQAPNQGYTQDANNFYVWYTTQFSTHQVAIQFTVPPATSLGLVLAVLITVAAIILIFIAIAIKRLRARAIRFSPFS